jgi:hypothetical protein
MLEDIVLFPTARKKCNPLRFEELFISAKHKNENTYKSQECEFAMKSLQITIPFLNVSTESTQTVSTDISFINTGRFHGTEYLDCSYWDSRLPQQRKFRLLYVIFEGFRTYGFLDLGTKLKTLKSSSLRSSVYVKFHSTYMLTCPAAFLAILATHVHGLIIQILAEKVVILRYWPYFYDSDSSEKTFRKTVDWSRTEWDGIKLERFREQDY